MTVFFPFLPSCFQKGIRCGVGDKFEGGVTYGPVVTVSVEMPGNGTGVELGVEVEVVAVREKLLKRGPEASGFRLGGFRGLFGGAVFAEARMSAELLDVGCIVLK